MSPDDDPLRLSATIGDPDARPDTILGAFYKFHDVFFLSSSMFNPDLHVRFALEKSCITHGSFLREPIFPVLCGYAPHWRGNVKHLAADGYYTSSCLHSARHAPCKGLLCLRRCVKGSLCGRYVLEWSVNAGVSRAVLWNTWVTLIGVILALAGEHGTTWMHNVSKLAECLCSLAADPEQALSYFSNIICKNCKNEVEKKRSRTSRLRKPSCTRVLWHEPSKQCVSDCGGRHATEYALTDPQVLNTALALRSFCNIKDVDVTFTTNAVHQTRRVWCLEY